MKDKKKHRMERKEKERGGRRGKPKKEKQR